MALQVKSNFITYEKKGWNLTLCKKKVFFSFLFESSRTQIFLPLYHCLANAFTDIDLWNYSTKDKTTSKIFQNSLGNRELKAAPAFSGRWAQRHHQHHSRGSWITRAMHVMRLPVCPSPPLSSTCTFSCPSTFQIVVCVTRPTLTWPAILPGAGAHPYSSCYIMLADLPAGSCCKPDWGPNPAKNNSIGGVKVTSSTHRVDWKHTQNHSFRVRFQSNFNTSKFWLPPSHLARKSPCLSQQVKLWDLQSPRAQTRGDCKSSNANQLC